MKRLILLPTVLILGALGFLGYRFLKQPASGITSSQISDRVSEFVVEHEQDQSVITSDSLSYDPGQDTANQLQTVKTDCFSIKLPAPISYLKSTSETSEETQDRPKCFVGGLFEKPRAQLTITAEYKPELTSLTEHTGVQLRQREQKNYEEVQVEALHSENYQAFAGETELTVIWLRQPVVYVISLHSMAKVTESSEQLLVDIIKAVEMPELDEPTVNSVY